MEESRSIARVNLKKMLKKLMNFHSRAKKLLRLAEECATGARLSNQLTLNAVGEAGKTIGFLEHGEGGLEECMETVNATVVKSKLDETLNQAKETSVNMERLRAETETLGAIIKLMEEEDQKQEGILPEKVKDYNRQLELLRQEFNDNSERLIVLHDQMETFNVHINEMWWKITHDNGILIVTAEEQRNFKYYLCNMVDYTANMEAFFMWGGKQNSIAKRQAAKFYATACESYAMAGQHLDALQSPAQERDLTLPMSKYDAAKLTKEELVKFRIIWTGKMNAYAKHGTAPNKNIVKLYEGQLLIAHDAIQAKNREEASAKVLLEASFK